MPMRQHRHAPLPVTTLLRRAAMARAIKARKQIQIKPASECEKPVIDLTERVFSRWVVSGFAGQHPKWKHRYWACVCECGGIGTVRERNLIKGYSLSCGCFHHERVGERSRTHGLTETSEYKIWSGIISRCYTPSATGYKHYGGRGITVCDRWLNSFELFLLDMGNKPSPEMSVDRIDSNRGYYPDNCRWATRFTQANNRRFTKVYSHDGESKTLSEWAQCSDIAYHTLKCRLKRGWSLSDAITRKVRR